MIKVIVVFPDIGDAKNIKNILMKKGFTVDGICTTGSQAIQFAEEMDGGIVICGYKLSDMMYTELQDCLPSCFEMLLVASKRLWSECAGTEVISVAMPIKIHELLDTIGMMVNSIAARQSRQKQRHRVRSGEDKNVLDQAKILLMERNNMTEEEAHRYIQKCSMDSGNNMPEMARMVLILMKS